MFYHSSTHGQLSINSVSLMAPSWRVLNLQTLQSTGEMLGDDRQIPGYGSKARLREATTSTYALEMLVCGDVNKDGTAYTNAVEGVVSNINYLRTQLNPRGTVNADGTYSATLTLAGGSTVTRYVHVLKISVGESVGYGKTRVVIDISVPYGEF